MGRFTEDRSMNLLVKILIHYEGLRRGSGLRPIDYSRYEEEVMFYESLARDTCEARLFWMHLKDIGIIAESNSREYVDLSRLTKYCTVQGITLLPETKKSSKADADPNETEKGIEMEVLDIIRTSGFLGMSYNRLRRLCLGSGIKAEKLD